MGKQGGFNVINMYFASVDTHFKESSITKVERQAGFSLHHLHWEAVRVKITNYEQSKSHPLAGQLI